MSSSRRCTQWFVKRIFLLKTGCLGTLLPPCHGMELSLTGHGTWMVMVSGFVTNPSSWLIWNSQSGSLWILRRIKRIWRICCYNCRMEEGCYKAPPSKPFMYKKFIEQWTPVLPTRGSHAIQDFINYYDCKFCVDLDDFFSIIKKHGYTWDQETNIIDRDLLITNEVNLTKSG